MSNLQQANANAGSLPIQQQIQSKEVESRFVTIYASMHGARDGERFYQVEKFHFLKILSENKKLASCDPMSLYGCFMDAAVNGLSFDPAMKHVYLVPINANIGTKDNPKWVTRCTAMISGDAELLMRRKQGQIKHADNPVLVYEGDVFKYGSRNGQFYVEHEVSLPRKSQNLIACYLRIVRNDDSVDYKVLTRDELEGLRAFSKDKNSLAWTQGLPGMFMKKTIKHAFKNYPKIRKGENTVVETEETVIIEPVETPTPQEAPKPQVLPEPAPQVILPDNQTVPESIPVEVITNPEPQKDERGSF